MAPKRRRKASHGEVGEYSQPGDHVSVLIHCSGDETFLLCDDEEGKGLWFPGSIVPKEHTWENAATEAVKHLFTRGVEVTKLIRLNRIWSTTFNQFVSHAFFVLDIVQEVKRACKLGSNEKWMTVDQIQAAYDEAQLLRTTKAIDIIRHYQDIITTPVYQEGAPYLNSLLHEVEKAEATDASAGSISAKEQLAAELAFERDQMARHGKQRSAIPEFELGTHVVELRRSGVIEDVSTLWKEGDALSETTKKVEAPGLEPTDVRHKFDAKSLPNQMKNALNFFCWGPKRGLTKDPYSWGGSDMHAYGNNIIKLSKMARDFIKKETRLLRLDQPIYVFGDIHGKLSDLNAFEKALWRAGPNLCPADLLFLGDYVDRGKHSAEVVTYLFAMKCLAPDKVHLLRGNHETRKAQKRYGFYKECLFTFGPELGEQVFEEVNITFDCLPIAAVVADKIFCAHGGIPPAIGGFNVNDFEREVPQPMSDPQNDSNVAWETMWCDPVEYREIDKAGMEVDSEGFSENLNRNTAHVFTPEALNSFLDRNGLTHVIRAHQSSETGFEVKHFAKLITIFSSSRYAGKANEPTCVLVDKHKIRIILIDTATGPAMDIPGSA